jgi:AcrR family transcriptional regulator
MFSGRTIRQMNSVHKAALEPHSSLDGRTSFNKIHVHMMNGVHDPGVSEHFPADDAQCRILAAAREVFSQDGYENFSMRHLAARAGCAVGTIYLHFKDKDGLLQAVVRQRLNRFIQSLAGLIDRHRNGDPVNLLKKGLYTYVEFGLRNPHDYRLALRLPMSPIAQTGPADSVFPLIHDMVTRCVEEGCFREIEVETAAQALWAAIHGITSLLTEKGDFPWVSRAKLIEHVINSAVDSLAPQLGRVSAKSA